MDTKTPTRTPDNGTSGSGGDRVSQDGPPVSRRYRVEGRLGAGGMGAVYRAVDRVSGARLALKTLHRLDADTLALFKNEFRSLAGVVHPNLVTLHELVEEDGLWYFTMDRVEGQSWLEYVWGVQRPPSGQSGLSAPATDSMGETEVSDEAVTRPFALAPPPTPVRDSAHESYPSRWIPDLDANTLARLRHSLVQLVWGVDALHRLGKLHRDLKPSNVMVTDDGQVVVLDFGLIQKFTSPSSREEDSVGGTAYYMSPEQVAGTALAPPADWYAVGVMLYEALTGTWPHRGGAIQVMLTKTQEDPVSPRSRNPDVPADLDAVCMGLLDRDPDRRPRADQLLICLGASSDRPRDDSTFGGVDHSSFVGREKPLGQLHAAFGRVCGGQRLVVHVTGSSGMGKSRLVSHFLEQVAQRSVVLSARCYERESVPHKALDPVVDALCTHLRSTPEATQLALSAGDLAPLARMFPVVGALFDEDETNLPDADPVEVRRQAFVALRGLLARVAAESPLIVVVDDLQWSDADSVVGFVEILRDPSPPPLLLLVCSRSEALARREAVGAFLDDQDRGGRHFPIDTLEIGPLDFRSSERLALQLLGDDLPQKDEVATRLARESSGMPLFIEELARHVSRGDLDVGVTASLDDVILRRFEKQPAEARALLETVAMAGQPIVQLLAWGAAGITDHGWKSTAQLAASRLVRTTGSDSAESVECFHDRIREVVSSAMEQDRQAEIHESLARILEDSGGGDPERLLYHWAGAGEATRAAHWAEIAGDQAAASLAFDKAAELFGRSLELLDEDASGRPDLARSRADALSNAGRGPEAGEAYLALSATAPPETAWRLETRAAMAFLESGHLDRGRKLLYRVLASMNIPVPSSRPGVIASFLFLRARLALRGMDFMARTQDEIPANLLDRADACSSAASGIGYADPLEGGVYQVRSMLLALETGDAERISRAMAMEGAFTAALGERGADKALGLLDQAQQMALDSDNPRGLGEVLAARTIAMLQLGRWRDCLDAATESRALLQQHGKGSSWYLSTAESYHLGALGFLGRLDEAYEAFCGALAHSRRKGDLHGELHARLGMEFPPYLIVDDPQRAATDAAQAADLFPMEGFHLHRNYATRAQAQVALYTGDKAAALDWADQLDKGLRGSNLKRVPFVWLLGQEILARSLLANLTRGVGERSLERRFLKTLRLLQRASLPWARAQAGLLEAQHAVVRDRRDQAAASFAEAQRRFDQLDMAFHAAAARWRLAELRNDPPHSSVEPFLGRQDLPNLPRLVRMVAPIGCNGT